MRNLLLLLLILASLNAIAQDGLNFQSLCQGRGNSDARPLALREIPLGEEHYIVADSGFCAEFLKSQTEDNYIPTTIMAINRGINISADIACPDSESNHTKKDKWKIRFYMGHSFTTYFKSDINFSSTRYNVEIQDYEWAERGSREYFNPLNWGDGSHSPLQVIDEPTNKFVLSIEKDGHEFFISVFHPKYFQEDGQYKYMKGNIDGTEVDGWGPINEPFVDYYNIPGEIKLVKNDNTVLQMTYEIGYGHRFKLLDTNFGSITWTPSFGIGLMSGQNSSVAIEKNEWWETDSFSDKYKLQGYGGSINNKIEFSAKNEKFGIFYENTFASYHIRSGFMDGFQEYNLDYMSNKVGVVVKVYDPKNRKKK